MLKLWLVLLLATGAYSQFSVEFPSPQCECALNEECTQEMLGTDFDCVCRALLADGVCLGECGNVYTAGNLPGNITTWRFEEGGIYADSTDCLVTFDLPSDAVTRLETPSFLIDDNAFCGDDDFVLRFTGGVARLCNQVGGALSITITGPFTIQFISNDRFPGPGFGFDVIVVNEGTLPAAPGGSNEDGGMDESAAVNEAGSSSESSEGSS